MWKTEWAKTKKRQRDKFSSFSCNECGESTALVNHPKILKCENRVMNFLKFSDLSIYTIHAEHKHVVQVHTHSWQLLAIYRKVIKNTFVLSILLIIHEISYCCITRLKTTQLYQVYSSVRQAFSILIIGTPAYNSKKLVLLDVFFSKGIQRLKYFWSRCSSNSWALASLPPSSLYPIPHDALGLINTIHAVFLPSKLNWKCSQEERGV